MDILGISWGFPGDILGISWQYLDSFDDSLNDSFKDYFNHLQFLRALLISFLVSIFSLQNNNDLTRPLQSRLDLLFYICPGKVASISFPLLLFSVWSWLLVTLIKCLKGHKYLQNTLYCKVNIARIANAVQCHS